MIEMDVSEAASHLKEMYKAVQVNAAEDFEQFFEQATLAFHEFPRPVRKTVNEFARRKNVDRALMIRGFPTDDPLPPTPTQSNLANCKPTQASEFWLCCIASVLREPIGYLQEKNGSIIQNMYPTQKNSTKLSSESSEINLDFHTEIAFHPFLPDYLLLYGLRQDVEKKAKTGVTCVRDILPYLTAQEKEILWSPLFKTGIDCSYGSTSGLRGNGPLLSILYGDVADPYFRYDLDLMLGITPQAQSILEKLPAIVREVKQEVAIEPGMLLVVDNRYCVHSRSQFKACYNGKDRWLQRMLVMEDLSSSSADRPYGGRVIVTDFTSYLQKEDVSSYENCNI
jgi:Taurine catabolism dioxygenase TauD, TfdA family